MSGSTAAEDRTGVGRVRCLGAALALVLGAFVLGGPSERGVSTAVASEVSSANPCDVESGTDTVHDDDKDGVVELYDEEGVLRCDAHGRPLCDRCLMTKADDTNGTKGKDTPIVNGFGCGVADQCPCNGPGPRRWRYRRSYLACIRERVKGYRHRKLIDEVQAAAILSKAKASPCGRIRRIAGDEDGDGVLDDSDNCRRKWNPDQRDQDHNGVGNRCDPDFDGDNFKNRVDNCPYKKNADQKDGDEDGVGDECDACQDTEKDADVDSKGCD